MGMRGRISGQNTDRITIYKRCFKVIDNLRCLTDDVFPVDQDRYLPGGIQAHEPGLVVLAQRQVYIVLFARQGFFSYCQAHLQWHHRGHPRRTIPRTSLSPRCVEPAPAAGPRPGPAAAASPCPGRPAAREGAIRGLRAASPCRPTPKTLTFCEEKDWVQWYSTSGAIPATARRDALRCAGRGSQAARARNRGRARARGGPALGNEKEEMPGLGGGRGGRIPSLVPPQCSEDGPSERETAYSIPRGKRRKMDAQVKRSHGRIPPPSPPPPFFFP